VAGGTPGHTLGKIAATLDAFRRAFELPVGQRALLRSEERTPADGKSDGDGENNAQDGETDEQNFPELFHSIPKVVVELPKRAPIINEDIVWIGGILRYKTEDQSETDIVPRSVTSFSSRSLFSARAWAQV
jgi:hypothetical protein